MRIFFAGGGTGGHLYPGLAIARALVALEPNARPLFVGARRGVERDLLPRTEFEHLLLDLHPLYRTRPWNNWRTVVGLSSAWRSLGRAARADPPEAVVGTGGYASGAALAWAVGHHVPLTLQEQNSHPGLTTRIFSPFAQEIYLGYGEARTMLRPGSGAWVGETGNPIEPPPVPRPDRAPARERWGFPASGGTVLLVVGGSQGARALNDVVAEWIRCGLPEGVYVIWGTGTRLYERYAELESERARVIPYISPIQEAYAASDVALTRAGALTLGELCAWAVPPIMIPLPTAAADHQTSNARALARVGAGVHITQAELTVERLSAVVAELVHSPERLKVMAEAALSRARPDAANAIAQRLIELSRLRQQRHNSERASHLR